MSVCGICEICVSRMSRVLPRRRKHRAPVVAHADDGPVPGDCFVPADAELLQFVVAIVGKLARGVVVVHEQCEACAWTGRGPLQHLKVAVRVAERGNRPPADAAVDADGFPLLVVDQVDLGELDEHGTAVAHFELQLAAAADNLLRRNAVDALRPGTHELDAPARHDVGLEGRRRYARSSSIGW